MTTGTRKTSHPCSSSPPTPSYPIAHAQHLESTNLESVGYRGPLTRRYFEFVNSTMEAKLASALMESRVAAVSAILESTDLESAILDKAKLELALLQEAKLERANLESTSRMVAILKSTNLEEAKVEAASKTSPDEVVKKHCFTVAGDKRCYFTRLAPATTRL